MDAQKHFNTTLNYDQALSIHPLLTQEQQGCVYIAPGPTASCKKLAKYLRLIANLKKKYQKIVENIVLQYVNALMRVSAAIHCHIT